MKVSKICIFLFLSFLVLIVIFFGIIAIYYIHEINIARLQTPELIDTVWKRYGKQLLLTDLSIEQRSLLLAVEDPAFMRHHGVDLSTPGAGMTTITQGLVKLLYFPNGFRPGVEKIRQTLIAQYALNQLVSKNDQLLLLLNISYLGTEDGKAIYGYANAAKTYFRKNFSALSNEEFLSLVAMNIGPDTYKLGTHAHDIRMKSIHAYLSGKIKPASLLDVEYNGKKHGSLSEELLMSFLRILTDSNPNNAGLSHD
jgi:membrane peptidoglycan carboxypeptidase